jgi:hypothetical protein
MVAESYVGSADKYQMLAEYHIDLRFAPSRHDDMYWAHAIGIATASGSGWCFCPHGSESCGDPGDSRDRDVRDLRDRHTCREIAALDAAFGVTRRPPALQCSVPGDPTAKSVFRANLIASEIDRIAQDGAYTGRPKLVMVGAVGNILAELFARKYRMHATDFDESLIGRRVAGVLVESGDYTLERIANCDIALVTGMTLATDSLFDILSTARASGTELVFFCQTGGNLASEYISHGARTIVAELFPFYMLPGTTEFLVFRSP